MKANLLSDDDLFEIYQDEAKQRGMEVGDVLRERLKLAVSLDPRGRFLIISDGGTMSQLEAILGLGHLRSAEDLLQKVAKLARIRFGDHTFELSAGQYQELVHRASKNGVTIAVYVQNIFRKMQIDFFKYTS